MKNLGEMRDALFGAKVRRFALGFARTIAAVRVVFITSPTCLSCAHLHADLGLHPERR